MVRSKANLATAVSAIKEDKDSVISTSIILQRVKSHQHITTGWLDISSIGQNFDLILLKTTISTINQQLIQLLSIIDSETKISNPIALVLINANH